MTNVMTDSDRRPHTDTNPYAHETASEVLLRSVVVRRGNLLIPPEHTSNSPKAGPQAVAFFRRA